MGAPSGTQTRLEHADQELVVVEVGGGIRSYERGGVAVIDGYGEGEICPGGRGQLLAPWPNRLADGNFDWQGVSHQTPLSEPEKQNAIHGLVRWQSWEVAEQAPDRATLRTCLQPQPGWPWPLDLEVTYLLNDRGLEVLTTVIHSGEPNGPSCPVGIGWHPYLAVPAGMGRKESHPPHRPLVDHTFLKIPAATAYESDERGLPSGRFDVAGTDLDFRAGRRVGASVLDTAFTDLSRGPDGRAWIELVGDEHEGGSLRTRMWVDHAYTHLMVYTGDTLGDTSRRRAALAVEPMTCAPNMLRTCDGMVVLEAGASFSACWGLEPFSF